MARRLASSYDTALVGFDRLADPKTRFQAAPDETINMFKRLSDRRDELRSDFGRDDR